MDSSKIWKKFIKRSFGTKEDFLNAYESTLASSNTKVENFCHFISKQIVDAIVEKNIELFKQLCFFVECFENIQDNEASDETLMIFRETDLFKTANVVILVCKHGNLNFLEYLFDNNGKIFDNFTCVKEISPSDEDEYCHNAFYYAIRCTNVKLLNKLIRSWPNDYFQDRPEELDTLISRAYEELKLKNVLLSEDTEMYIEKKLISLRFFSKPSNKRSTNNRQNEITDRFDLLISFIKNKLNIKDILDSCGVNKIVLYNLKFVAENIHILKQQLRHTYDKLPWEEIEFCIICFITSFTKREELNIFYHSVLDKQRICEHLDNFAKLLEQERKNFDNQDKIDVSKLKRGLVVERITKDHPELTGLYEDFQKLRDVYTLHKINSYMNLVQSADPSTKTGQLIIIRTLQLLGEYLKNTLESPKLSDHTSNLLLMSLSKEVRSVIIDLRNSLSHVYSLSKRMAIESNTDVDFFIGIQQDAKKIMNVVTDVFCNYKIKTVVQLLQKVNQIDTVDDFFKISKAFENVKFNLVDDSKQSVIMEYKKLEKLFQNIEICIKDKNAYEAEILKKLNEEIAALKDYSKNIKNDYLLAVGLLNSICIDVAENKIDQNVIKDMKFRAQTILHDIIPKIEPRCWKKIKNLVHDFLSSVLPRIQDENVINTVRSHVSEAFFIIEHDSRNISYIKELREKLEQRYFFSFHQQHSMKSQSFDQLDEKLAIKLTELKNILQDYSLSDQQNFFNIKSYKNNEQLRAAVEILVLDIMTIYGSSKLYLQNNVLFLDDNSPLLNGKYLRNHLAHDNALVDLLLCDPSLAIFFNADKLVRENIAKSKKKLGKSMSLDLLKLKEKYDNNIAVIANQEKMFLALEKGDLRSFEECVEKGADVLGRDAKMSTALHYAAKSPNLGAMKFLTNVDVNARDLDGRTPLYVASMCGNNNMIEYLINKAKADVNVTDNLLMKSPLHAAAQYGRLQAVKILIKNGCSVSRGDITGTIPLFYATRNDHVKVAEVLLEKNVNSYECLGGFTLLHSAVENGNPAMVEFLLEKGADVNAKTEGNWTALHAASRDGLLDLVNLLISKGANVNEAVINGCTSLYFAVENSHDKIVAVLIENGARVNVCDHSCRFTPLHIACREGHAEIVETLLANEASMTARTSENETPLDFAVKFGHSEIVKILLNHAASYLPNYSPEFGPLLFLAAEGGFEDVAKILLQNGAVEYVNVQNSFGMTALHQAALKNHEKIVELLADNSASVNTRDKEGHTPLHAAAASTDEKVIRYLIDKGANVEEKNLNGQTPLLIAAFAGNLVAVKTLVERGASLESRDLRENGVLHVAIRSGKKNVVQFLLQKGAAINTPAEEKTTPLHLAINGGLKNIVKLLINEGANLDAETSSRATPLMFAIKNNHLDIVKALLAKRCDVNVNSGVPLFVAIGYGFSEIVEELLRHKASPDALSPDDSKTPLLHVAVQKGHANIVSLLIKSKVFVDCTNMHKDTALHLAAEMGFPEIAKILIEAKAKVDAKSKEGLTPLHKAAGKGNVEVVKILLGYVKNINTKDYENRTALELAVAYGHVAVVELILKNEFFKAQININSKGNNDWTMLHIACQQKNVDMVKCLVEHGADIFAKNDAGTKPIHIAARDGFKDTVEYLLSMGQNVNDITSKNVTPIHYAALGQIEVVKLLITKNADLNATDPINMTPLHFAVSSGHLEIVKLLLSHGAFCNSLAVQKRKPLDFARDVSIKKILLATEELFDAVKKNDVSKFVECIKYGAILNAKNSKNISPLHYAAWKGCDKIVQLALQNQANPNIVGDKNYTPLHYAAKFSHNDIVKLLLSHGAVYESSSETSKTALDFSTDEECRNLLKTVSKIFAKVGENDTTVLDDIKNIRDDETLKALYNCKNVKHQTLIIVATCNEFPKLHDLNKIMMGDSAGQIQKAEILMSQNNFEEALRVLERALESKNKLLGPDNPFSLEIKKTMGRAFISKGACKDAFLIFKEVGSKEEAILGPDHQNTLRTKSLFAYTLNELGKNKEALTIFRKVYAKQKEILGPEHEDFLMTYFHMALLLTDLEMFDEALAANKEIYDIRKKILGEDDPLTVVTLNNVGLVLFRQEKYEEALTIFKDVCEKKRRIFGSEHRSFLITLENIAGIHSNMGNHSEALKSFQHIVDIKKRIIGQNHPDTLTSIFNMGNIYFSQHKWMSAMKIYSEIYDTMRQVLGWCHPTVAELEKKMKHLKDIYKVSGRNLKEDLHHLQSSSLFTLASEGESDKLEEFLKQGFDVNIKDDEGRTPLHFAVHNEKVNITKLLLSYRADVTSVTKKGNTVLHVAALRGNRELLEILLQHASQNRLSDYINTGTYSKKTTPLHVAAQKGDFCMTMCLLRYGAAYDAVNTQNQKPVDVSTNQKVTDLLEIVDVLFKAVKNEDLKTLDKLKTLEKNEFDAVVGSRNARGLKLLQMASSRKNINVAKRVLDIVKDKSCKK